MFKIIGWKDCRGRWCKDEIFIDVVVVILAGGMIWITVANY